jgi:uncharacterized membrane protein
MSDQALRVVELQAENVMRLKAVRIRPDGDVVIIGGENAQGKSAVLACIEMAIAGAKAIPGAPVRRGESEAHIILDLGEIRIERTFDPTGTKLVVRGADGTPKKSPQALLDSLYSKVAFNPLEFASQKPAEQLATLKRIVGLDFAELDAQRAALYQKRTEIGRVYDAAELKVTSYPVACVTAPDVEVSVAALMAEKEAVDAVNADVDEKLRRVAMSSKRLEQLRKELAEAEDEDRAANADAMGTAKEDTTAIVEAIKGAEDINRMVRAKRERQAACDACKKLEDERRKLTEGIDAIDAQKADAMKRAPWPIPGLGFSADGVTLNRLPFEQASAAERLKTSLAIGMEQNPRLRVLLLQDASLLDKSSMAILREMASDNNMQIWIERVGDGDEGAIIIEDGEIKGTQ